MRRLILLALLSAVATAQGVKDEGLAGGGKKDEGDPGAPVLKLTLQEKINKAIKAGVKWLKARQLKDGSWGPCHADKRYDSNKPGGDCHYSGPTSFAIYTLSKCDVPKKDKDVVEGLKWLRGTRRYSQIWTDIRTENPKSRRAKGPPIAMDTYEIASLVMMLEALHERSEKLTQKRRPRKGRKVKEPKRLMTADPREPPRKSKFRKDRKFGKKDWLWLHEAVHYMTEATITITSKKTNKRLTSKGLQRASGPQKGGWRYGQQPPQIDTSATQFALLGLRAASQAGYPVKPRVWMNALNALKALRMPDGTFPYRKGEKMSAGMTAAGVASALICKEQLELAGQPVPAFTDGLIKTGIERIDQLFDVTKNQGFRGAGGAYHYYYLYGIERVGDLTGRSEFNGKNWYVRGAQFLLAQQDASGKWVDSTCMKPKDVLGTCFALLFLKRATVPTVTISGN